MPPAWALACGRGIGLVSYWVQPKRRAICLGNLKAAFAAEKPPEELEQICRGTFQTIGMSFVEVLLTPAIDEAYVDRWITVVGREHFDRALAQGRGLILVTGHYGNWEMTSLMAGLKGYPMSVLARPQGLPRLNALLNRYRESKGCRVISKGMAVRTMVRHLRDAGIVGVLADQDAGRRGVLAPFFGRLASTAPGPVSMALRLGCPIVPAFILRTNGLAHTVYLEPPLAFARTNDGARDTRAGVAAYLEVLERFVRRAPDQWLWPHRRWKTSPHQGLVIFDDGKAGHRTQALAVAEMVEQVWADGRADDPRLAGFQGPFLQRQVVQVRFRAPWRRRVLTLAAMTGATEIWPAWRWLRWALTAESSLALDRAWAAVTVSCGAVAGLVNVVWSCSVGARAIQIMRPPWPFGRRFALRIVPRHDRPPESARTIVTRGALHGAQIDQQDSAIGEWRRTWSLRRPVQIGVLIGGETRGVQMPASLVAAILDQVLEAAEQLDAELLVTSSRRTPPAVETLLERRLAGHARCGALILARRDGAAGEVPKILAVSSAVVASGESMSMVSEAASSGKPVFVFELRSWWPWPKYRRFLRSLASERYVQVVKPPVLARRLVDAVRQPSAMRPLDDRSHVLGCLRKWV